MTAAALPRTRTSPVAGLAVWAWLWPGLGVLVSHAFDSVEIVELPGLFPPSPEGPVIAAVSPGSGPSEGGRLHPMGIHRHH